MAQFRAPGVLGLIHYFHNPPLSSAAGPRSSPVIPGPVGARNTANGTPKIPTYAETDGPDPVNFIFEESEIFGPEMRKENHAYGPTGSKTGTGGYLEFNLANKTAFTNYFNPLMPMWLVPADLMILSSTFEKKPYDNYRVLPPKDLWPKMAKTLEVLTEVQEATNAVFEIRSAYRSKYVNKISKGSTKSKHMIFCALDITPAVNDQKKVRAYLEHLWWEKGDDLKLGLGYYSLRRFHIDTHERRRKQAGWIGNDANAKPARRVAKKNYEKYFSTPLI